MHERKGNSGEVERARNFPRACTGKIKSSWELSGCMASIAGFLSLCRDPLGSRAIMTVPVASRRHPGTVLNCYACNRA